MSLGLTAEAKMKLGIAMLVVLTGKLRRQNGKETRGYARRNMP